MRGAQQCYGGQDTVGKVRAARGGKAVAKGPHQGQNQGLSVHPPLLQTGVWRSYRSGLRTLYLWGAKFA